MIEDLIRLLTLQDHSTRVVMLGTGLLGMTSGVIGTFAVLRRRALVGDAVAHAALPGLCVAYLIVGGKSLPAFLAGALVFGILGVLCITFIRGQTRIKEDAAIGLVLSTFFGLGIAMLAVIQRMPTGEPAGLNVYIFGKAAAMIRQDVYLIGGVSAVVLLTLVVLYKELRLLSFDREFAASQGWPAFFLDMLMMGLLCLCTVIGLPAVGVVLMSALLIIPGAAARFWTDRLHLMLVLAGAIGAISCVVGSGVSALGSELPTGPLIVVAAASMFLVSMLLAPRRGVIAETIRRMKMRKRVARQHVLRGIYELTEAQGDSAAAVGIDELESRRSWARSALLKNLAAAAAQGLVNMEDDRCALTSDGAHEAARLVRAHRLWEMFLIEEGTTRMDAVDRDADEIEHHLPAAVIAKLENQLRQQGRLPEPMPASPHRIGGQPS